MTETVPTAPWRTPQLLRDLKPERPGVAEAIEPLPLHLAIPLLIGKCHGELFEVSEEPDNPEEYGDLLEAVEALGRATGHNDLEPCETIAPVTPGAGAIHRALEAFARDMTQRSALEAIVGMIYGLASARGVSFDTIQAAKNTKAACLGGFDGHKLWRRLDGPKADIHELSDVPVSMGYEPELGQLLFGQPSQAYGVPNIMEAALDAIREEYDRVYWNVKQQDCPSPFSNSGSVLITPVFEAHAYSWGDEEQPFNFKWRDLLISWYKYAGRGMSANMPITPQMVSQCLDECLACIRAMEPDNDADEYPNFIDLS